MSPEQQAYSIVFRSPWESWCLRMRQPAAYRARTQHNVYVAWLDQLNCPHPSVVSLKTPTRNVINSFHQSRSIITINIVEKWSLVASATVHSETHTNQIILERVFTKNLLYRAQTYHLTNNGDAWTNHQMLVYCNFFAIGPILKVKTALKSW